jgi:hypothetical protein
MLTPLKKNEQRHKFYELQSPLITYDVGVVVVEFFLPNMLTDPPAECACAFYGPS